jgi:hypothetical protein
LRAPAVYKALTICLVAGFATAAVANADRESDRAGFCKSLGYYAHRWATFLDIGLSIQNAMGEADQLTIDLEGFASYPDSTQVNLEKIVGIIYGSTLTPDQSRQLVTSG